MAGVFYNGAKSSDADGRIFFELKDLSRILSLVGTIERPGAVNLGIDGDGGGYATLMGKGAIGVLDKDGYRRQTQK